MEIFQPLQNKQIYIVANFLDSDVAELCSDYYHALLFYSGKVSDREKLALGWVPNKDSLKNDELVYGVIKEAIEKMKAIMKEYFPEQEIELFKTYQDVSVRTPEGSKLDGKMSPHVDGPGEKSAQTKNIRTVGGLLYINDNYDGGELTYPNLNYEYKPAAGSFVMHLGMDEDYLHGVNEIKNGWRFNLGIFGYEDYPEFNESEHFGDQGRDKFK